jgi:hypothetical protein
MNTLLNSITEMAALQVQQNGEEIEYTQDGETIYPWAIASKPEMIIDDPGGPMLEHDDLNWMMVAADVIIGGDMAQPKPGARIRRYNAITASFENYEVRSKGKQECFQRMDPLGRVILIHTKRVEDQA